MDLPESTMKKLVCSKCKEALSVFPVHSYENGDFVCGRCPLNSKQNPSRDYSYEAIAEDINFPCLHKPHGCFETLVPAELSSHERTCTYKQWFCPHISELCLWKGALDDLEDHYKDAHETFLLADTEVFLLAIEKHSERENYLVEAYNTKFLVELEIIGMYALVNVSLIGVEKTSDWYNYTINVWNNTDSIESPQQEVQINYGNVNIDQKHASLIDLQTIKGFKNLLKFQVMVTKSIKEEPEKLTPLNECILKQIKCSACNEYMYSEIFQCPNIHVICPDCKRKFPNCPTCKIAIGDNRNRSLEQIAENILFPCINEGCSRIYQIQDKEAHESNCEFESYDCPFDCEHESEYSGILGHVKEAHFENLLQRNTINVYFASIEHETYIMKKGVSLFVVEHQLVETDFYVNVMHYGSVDEANSFYFICDVRNSDKKQYISVRGKCLEEDSEYYSSVQVPLNFMRRFSADIYFTYSIRIVEDRMS